MLAFIPRGFKYRNRNVLLQLYRALVRPALLCAVLVSLSEEGCSFFGSAEKVYQADSWNGRTKSVRIIFTGV